LRSLDRDWMSLSDYRYAKWINVVRSDDLLFCALKQI
jgi:hypothetical protein